MTKKKGVEAAQAASEGAGGPGAPADLAARMKYERGGRANAQIRVLKRLLDLAGDGQEIELPNLSQLARDVGLSRQCVGNAMVRLRKRNLVEERTMTVPVVSRHRKVRLIVPHTPDQLRQLALPFEAEAAA